MRRVETAQALRAELERLGNGRVAFVPTMGYLHEGHLSLVRHARQIADHVVVSIFVNPLQFGPGEDLESYPRDEGRDLAHLEAEGVAIAFVPTVDQIYPPGFATRITVGGTLTDRFCGPRRPGHFDGVATVVARLFGLVRPDVAIFGAKDYQQLQMIRRMVSDLALPVEVVGCPIVREPDGLAMSSRNVYLAPEERVTALALHRSLEAAERRVKAGERDPDAVVAAARAVLEGTEGLRVDYVELGDAETLAPVERIDRPVVLAIAAFVGRARLIDNRVFRPEETGRE